MDREVAVCCKRFHSSSLTNEVALPKRISLLSEMSLLFYLAVSWKKGHRIEVKRFEGGIQEPQQALGIFVYFTLKGLRLQGFLGLDHRSL